MAKSKSRALVRQWMLLHSDFNIFVHNQLMFSFSEISERTFLKKPNCIHLLKNTPTVFRVISPLIIFNSQLVVTHFLIM